MNRPLSKRAKFRAALLAAPLTVAATGALIAAAPARRHRSGATQRVNRGCERVVRRIP